MSVLKRYLPVLLLITFVLVPVFLLGAAGAIMLRQERDRWEARHEVALRRWMEQPADDIREGLDALRESLLADLNALPHANAESALASLHDKNPIVRRSFRVPHNAPAWASDENTRLANLNRPLLHAQAPDDPPLNTSSYQVPAQQLQRRGAMYNIANPKSNIDLPPSSTPVRDLTWRTHRHDGRDKIFLYLLREQQSDLVGVELDMDLLYVRLEAILDVWSKQESLALLDRNNQRLIGVNPPTQTAPLTTEIGPLLPFARLALYARPERPLLSGQGFYLLAAGFGLLLLLSISGAGLGLTAWLNRSRREALHKTSFVSNVSHEFKTPLTTLRLYSELLLENRIHDSEKRTRYLRTMRDESDRLARLVHNVLDFSRLELKRNSLKPEPLDLSIPLRKTTDALHERFQAAGIRLSLPDPPLPVRADLDAAEQIILNLCDNVLKHARGATHLHITAHTTSNQLALSFQDDGPGIPREQRKHLFKAFHQVDTRLARARGGTGLGLHLARRLARELGGDLRLAPPSPGACFIWTLPASTNSPA